MPGAAAQVGHVLIDIHRVTREASRAERHEFVGKRGTATRDGRPGVTIRGTTVRAGQRPICRASYRSIVSGLRSAR
ncbi:hypothetical protein DF150_16825 [Burkholderia cenocepacia]|nr:hypothetical protein DF150_16825 [Burkholderia cenocepacia]HDR9877081.1 hypothetical protein [Burkholderia cenocepacia]HDR9884150.1 hypothetical protein [Burkholderia cenocepacia]